MRASPSPSLRGTVRAARSHKRTASGQPDAEFAASAFAKWRRTGEVPRALQELRACLWFEQRRWRFMGREPDAEGMQYAAALIRAMRNQLGS